LRSGDGAFAPGSPTGPTGGPPPIMLFGMSFAVAMFANGGKDVLLGVDRRWVDGERGHYRVLSDAGTKSIAINTRNGLAFTGNAELIALIASRLYDDTSLFVEPYTAVLERIEGLPESLGLDTEEIIHRLDEIVPDARRNYRAECMLSIILAGCMHGKTVMAWWCQESQWKSSLNWYGEEQYVATLPPESLGNNDVLTGTHMCLKLRVLPEERIRSAIGFLSSQGAIQTVSSQYVIRRRSRAFAEEEY